MSQQETFKKLESGSPSGGLIARDNLQQVVGNGVDLNDSSALVSAGYVAFNLASPPGNNNYLKEYVEDGAEELVTGLWETKWKLQDRSGLSADETNDAKKRGYVDLRRKRDYLLSLTDFHAFSDTPTMSSAITTYRQTLRDLPANTADPFNVSWPSNPDDPDGSKYHKV